MYACHISLQLLTSSMTLFTEMTQNIYRVGWLGVVLLARELGVGRGRGEEGSLKWMK
jgi:hypothetical protein